MGVLKDIFDILKDAIDQTNKLQAAKRNEVDTEKLSLEVKELKRSQLEANYIELVASIKEIQRFDPKLNELHEGVRRDRQLQGRFRKVKSRSKKAKGKKK